MWITSTIEIMMNTLWGGIDLRITFVDLFSWELTQFASKEGKYIKCDFGGML